MSSNPYAQTTMDTMNRVYGREELEKTLVFEGDINIEHVGALMNEQITHMKTMAMMAQTVDFGLILEGRKIVFDNLRLIEDIITEIDQARKLYFKLGNLSLTEYQVISMSRLRDAVLDSGVSQ